MNLQQDKKKWPWWKRVVLGVVSVLFVLVALWAFGEVRCYLVVSNLDPQETARRVLQEFEETIKAGNMKETNALYTTIGLNQIIHEDSFAIARQRLADGYSISEDIRDVKLETGDLSPGFLLLVKAPEILVLTSYDDEQEMNTDKWYKSTMRYQAGRYRLSRLEFIDDCMDEAYEKEQNK